jgi:signal transduction histidine kinase
MKLTRYLVSRITWCFTAVMLLWSGLYFVLQMKEIHDGNDEGLTNLKQEFIHKANRLPDFVENMERDAPLNLIVREITPAEASRVKEHFHTARVYFETEQEDEEVRMLTAAFRCEQNGRYYLLRFFTSTVEREDLLENLLYLLLGLWLTLVATLLTVSRLILRRANRPFFRTLELLRRFRLDNSRIPEFPQTKIAEYARLNATVGELLERNMRTFTEQKEFIENCAHELQTPLAIALGKLDVLLERYREDTEHAASIAVILQTLNRMKRLNSQLLLLSKIRNRQFPSVSEVDLRRILDETLNDFTEIARYRRVTVEITGTARPVRRMNGDLARVLLTNLIKNAIIHNRGDGVVRVVCQADRIRIANHGTDALTDVFSRYRSDHSSGLGLSIARSIATLYGFDLTYGFDNGEHLFDLNLP